MKFRDLKCLVYSPIVLVIGDSKLYPFSIDNIPSNYDNYEVIGVRSLNDDSTFYEDSIIISLKKPLFKEEGTSTLIEDSFRELIINASSRPKEE